MLCLTTKRHHNLLENIKRQEIQSLFLITLYINHHSFDKKLNYSSHIGNVMSLISFCCAALGTIIKCPYSCFPLNYGWIVLYVILTTRGRTYIFWWSNTLYNGFYKCILTVVPRVIVFEVEIMFLYKYT